MFYFTYFLGEPWTGGYGCNECRAMYCICSWFSVPLGPVVSSSGVDNLHSAGTLLLAAVLCKRPGQKTFAWRIFSFQTCHLCSEDDRPEAECRTRTVVETSCNILVLEQTCQTSWTIDYRLEDFRFLTTVFDIYFGQACAVTLTPECGPFYHWAPVMCHFFMIEHARPRS